MSMMAMKNLRKLLYLLMSGVLFNSCDQHQTDNKSTKQLFTSLDPIEVGIDFVNNLTYTNEFNVYTYRNYYNGGGVAAGDINNDGLLDLYFCGNTENNKLYLNRGNWQFEDITENAGVVCPDVWSTGVSMTDVNGDGYLDIYVCKSGDPNGDNRHNELFINNGDLTFTERAADYQIADMGLSTHAAFFDYDKDNDLDCYLLNNSFRAIGSFDLRPGQREKRDSLGGNKLYRNDGDRFTDVSEDAHIYGSIIGFGLGVTVGDVNRDGWQDIYVSNDFFERDYLYINQQDGTFKEDLEAYMKEISAASMGADMADINNDGYPEIFVTDMLPRDDARMKTKTTFENWDKYQLNVRNGYGHQFTRNVLQLNNGDGTFSEIGRLADVHATDWSWGALIMDLDNDGLKDLFVANGIYQDLTDQDYINFFNDRRNVIKVIKRDSVGFIKELIDAIPIHRLPNYAFHNNGDLTFTNMAEEWGLGEPSHSNGSVYADMDNDGDMDLIVNNVNMPPFIYKNETSSLIPQNHYLKFDLVGEGKNTFALGTQILVRHRGKVYYQEQMPMRGFQSTVDHRPHIGLGEVETVDSVEIYWPNGNYTLLKDVRTNQTLRVLQEESFSLAAEQNDPEEIVPIFTESTQELSVSFAHHENDFIDFDREKLLYYMVSAEGPKMCTGDVNGDGREDFFIGGAKDQTGALFIQKANLSFQQRIPDAFQKDAISEDIDCEFFDADNDGDLDLYVASGGNEFPASSSALFDRLYLNDGKGNFEKSSSAFSSYAFNSSSCVEVGDYDQDGDNDIFVGTRLKPFYYGHSVSGRLLSNDGKGVFTEVNSSSAPDLEEIGLITDMKWWDYDDDGDLDMVVVGEWMPIGIFNNEGGKFTKVNPAEIGLAFSEGLWNCVEIADMDQDGDQDLIVANHGLNTRIKSSTDKPVSLYVNDFDNNGTSEQILSVYNGSESYPLVLRHDLIASLPGLKKKYLKYENYKNQTVFDIFSAEQIKNSVNQNMYLNTSSYIENLGDGTFDIHPLPLKAQFAPMYGVSLEDFDKDGYMDILMGGNYSRVKPEIGNYGATYGVFLKGDGKGHFKEINNKQTGFLVKGEIRDLASIKLGSKKAMLVAKNDDSMQAFIYR